MEFAARIAPDYGGVVDTQAADSLQLPQRSDHVAGLGLVFERHHD
jgi:hypothetical protein